MKRVFQSPSQKRRRRAQAKQAAKARDERYIYIRVKNNEKNMAASRSSFSVRSRPTPPQYDREIRAPRHFSLLTNPEETLDFISKLKEAFKKKQKTYVILRDVEVIEDDAIVILLSIMVRFKAMKIRFNGDFPLNKEAEDKLNQSGFLNNLLKKIDERERYRIAQAGNNTIVTHAWKNVDPTLSASVIQRASTSLWGNGTRCQGVQRVLLELMLNTNNHASPIMTGEKHWWLSMSYDPIERKCKFSFVDYGVGIFESLEKKVHGSKFYGILSKLRALAPRKDNASMLEQILHGVLHKTATGKDYRGKGLPGIYQAFARNQISSLYIISNDVIANASTGVYHITPVGFEGTFVYWELTASNEHCLAA